MDFGSTITGGFGFGSSFGGADKEHWPYWNTISYEVNDDVSVVKGNHQFAVGGGTLLGKVIELARFADGGQLRWSGAATGLGMGDFLTGRLTSLFQGQPNKNQINQFLMNAYVADTWKVTPKLAANIGVRWDPFISQTIPDIVKGTPGAVYNFNHDRFHSGSQEQRIRECSGGFLLPG